MMIDAAEDTVNEAEIVSERRFDLRNDGAFGLSLSAFLSQSSWQSCVGDGLVAVVPSQPAAVPPLALLVVARIRRESGSGSAPVPLSENLGSLEFNDGGG